ncbi:hypothetical protein JCM19037_4655 [Geomicrobium sp. JCM 19037]|uniref:hypothetical protein n=1 Tax=Geomicrobium sp. JCM 19037 TaxID=1460634 RepID=UPI00045F1C49|nr:hypothetical protein [Geomicrobium sp. JCM 19037]GAK06094.1 hypothetical protein JCM19037_4655 [Geomicrobium sp. JCM 19037]
MKKFYVKARSLYNQRVNNEDGAVSFEWIMLGMLAVAVIGVVIAALDGNGDGLATAIMGVLTDLVESISDGI